MSAAFLLTVLLSAPVAPAAPALQHAGPAGNTERDARKTCVAPDGVTIVYSAAGAGDTALVFVHGGMANRSFFDRQLQTFAGRYRVIALDLAGHGESGANRKTWSMEAFGADVKAVADAENLTRVILFGNSLGGPAAIEAALLLPGRVLGVVGIDTFQDIGHPETPEYARLSADAARKRTEALRADFRGAMKDMMKMLFHADADAALVADVERRMLRASPEATFAMLAGIEGYDSTPSARKLTVPLRTINGDLYPTDVERIRKIKPDFDAVVLPHTGHYPMLERPEEFNRHVERVAEELTKRGGTIAAAAQSLERVNPEGLATPRAYTHVIKAGKLLFIAGQVALDENNQVVGTTMAEQVDRALANLETALKSQGADLSHVAKTTIFTTSIAEFTAPDAVAARMKRMGSNRPASTLVQVQQLADPRFKVEIEAIAVLP